MERGYLSSRVQLHGGGGGVVSRRNRSTFWLKAHAADAPSFRTVPCPTCRALAGEYCTRGSKACQTRIDLALQTANDLDNDLDNEGNR